MSTAADTTSTTVTTTRADTTVDVTTKSDTTPQDTTTLVHTTIDVTTEAIFTSDLISTPRFMTTGTHNQEMSTTSLSNSQDSITSKNLEFLFQYLEPLMTSQSHGATFLFLVICRRYYNHIYRSAGTPILRKRKTFNIISYIYVQTENSKQKVNKSQHKKL